LGPDGLAVGSSSSALHEAPDAHASDEPCKQHERNHDGSSGNFICALLAVVILDHAYALGTLELARPGLNIKDAEVVAHIGLGGIPLRSKNVDVVVAEMRRAGMSDVNVYQGEEDDDGIDDVKQHYIATEYMRLCLCRCQP